LSKRRGRRNSANTAPDYWNYNGSVFLAGSIEMNKATEWQKRVVAALEDLSVAILNPRRMAWDPDWEQRPSNPDFRAQVTWEHDGLDTVDVVALYFEAGTNSTIALMELAKVAAERPKDIVVCCPEGFWRVGNVEMTVERYELCLVRNFADMVEGVRRRSALRCK
jgi:hypothetical protein